MSEETKDFYVDEELCTGCGDCIKELPDFFRDTGEETAEVVRCDGADPAKLDKVIKLCPGKAIKWR